MSTLTMPIPGERTGKGKSTTGEASSAALRVKIDLTPASPRAGAWGGLPVSSTGRKRASQRVRDGTDVIMVSWDEVEIV